MRATVWFLALAALMAVGCNNRPSPRRDASAPRSAVVRQASDAGSPRPERDPQAEAARRALMTRLQEAIHQPIEEPTGLPAFRIFQEVNGLRQPPSGSRCRWVRYQDRWSSRAPVFLPASFLEGGEFHYVRRDFNCGFPAETSWSNVLKGTLMQFVRAPRAHEDILGHAAFAPADGNDHLEVMAAYGLLQTDLIDEGGTEAWYDFRTNVLPRIYASELLLDRAFAWAMPHLNRVWRALPTADQTNYRDLLHHARAYATNFDEAAEVAYLHRLESGQCDHPLNDASSMSWFRSLARPGYPASACTHEFTRRGPDGLETPYRKLQAWVFRRIHDGMPRERFLRYLDRVLAALPPV